MLQGVNLKNELEKIRNKELKETQIINWVESIFLNLDQQRSQTLKTLRNSNSNLHHNIFDFNKIDANAVFHISQIKKICIDYRLRFLDTKYFKNEYPEEVITKINELERLHNTTLNGFKIAAPSVLFKLKKADDPLLFTPMGNDYYYLIHKWGNDLHPFRKYKFWAAKNVTNFAIALFVISFLLTITTAPLFFKEVNVSYVVVLFLFYLKGAIGFGLFFGISSGKNFSEFAWQSKYDKIC